MTVIYDNNTSPMSVTTSGGIRGGDGGSDSEEPEPMTTIPLTHSSSGGVGGGGGGRRKKESTARYNNEREMCLQCFEKWSEQDQLEFMEHLLSRMCHYQHGHINAFLKPMLQRDFITLLPSEYLCFIICTISLAHELQIKNEYRTGFLVQSASLLFLNLLLYCKW